MPTLAGYASQQGVEYDDFQVPTSGIFSKVESLYVTLVGFIVENSRQKERMNWELLNPALWKPRYSNGAKLLKVIVNRSRTVQRRLLRCTSCQVSRE